MNGNDERRDRQRIGSSLKCALEEGGVRIVRIVNEGIARIARRAEKKRIADPTAKGE
jgi:hypothetical protein